MSRPRVALAMMAGMLGYAFTPEALARLDAVADVVDREPLTDLGDARAARVLGEAEVLLGHWGCPTLTTEVLERAPRLRAFVYAAGTVKWQVTDAVWARDLLVTSAAAANAVPVAEYAVAMILLANKGVLLFRELMRDPQLTLPIDGARLGNVGRVIGLVGASHVGRLVVDLLRPYDLDVRVYDPYLDEAGAASLGVTKVADLDELCAVADVLSLHAPDIEATRGMVGRAQLARLRDGAVLLNTARPALVDQDALLTELQAGRIAAILDVTEPEPLPPDHPLLALPNAFVTPHVAGAVGSELTRLADLAITEIERYSRGEAPLHPVRREDLDRIA